MGQLVRPDSVAGQGDLQVRSETVQFLQGTNMTSLYDYRKRIATYRTDLDLVASHQQFPWIPVWDDHEARL